MLIRRQNIAYLCRRRQPIADIKAGPEQVSLQKDKFLLGVFVRYCVYNIRNHIMTQRYGKIIQRNSFSESCPDDAEFVRRAERSKTGPVVFYGDRDRVAAYRI